MIIGVPREIKPQEHRVGLPPGSVRELVALGHAVLVESRAGEGIGADGRTYERVGATVVPDAADVFARFDMIVKVKEPQLAEWARLREGQNWPAPTIRGAGSRRSWSA